MYICIHIYISIYIYIHIFTCTFRMGQETASPKDGEDEAVSVAGSIKGIWAKQIAIRRLAASRASKVKAGPKQPSAPPPKHLLVKAGPKQPSAPPPKHLLPVERRELTEEEKNEAVHRALMGIEMTEAERSWYMESDLG